MFHRMIGETSCSEMNIARGSDTAHQKLRDCGKWPPTEQASPQIQAIVLSIELCQFKINF